MREWCSNITRFKLRQVEEVKDNPKKFFPTFYSHLGQQTKPKKERVCVCVCVCVREREPKKNSESCPTYQLPRV